MDGHGLNRLREERFPELPLDCGVRIEPGIADLNEWRDWTVQPTTPDQLRIEEYLDRHDLAGKTILHIGTGNSELARRFHGRVRSIFGTSVVPSEVERGEALGIPNYRAILHNKHSGSNDEVPCGFDFIVDNNPTTFCCCLVHLESMLDFYGSRLTPTGQVVTDRVGLGWTTEAEGSNPRWRFDFDDLAAVAPLAGLIAYAITDYTYVLSRQPPAPPAFASRLTHMVRSTLRKVRRRLAHAIGRPT